MDSRALYSEFENKLPLIVRNDLRIFEFGIN